MCLLPGGRSAVSGWLAVPYARPEVACGYRMKAALTDEMFDLLEEVRVEAYAAGQLDALREFAREHARLELLGENWRERAIADHRALVQARHDAANARYEERLIADNIAAGRHPGYRYRGGAVDFETGLPEGSACAWLRRKQRQNDELATVTELHPSFNGRSREQQVAA